MKRTDIKAKGGFTLIEVVIVLAIAALIMVIVFLGVSGAQRAQRDTQRKDVANRMLALSESFAGANEGNYPNATTCSSFNTQYLAKENAKDPSTGNPYNASTNCVTIAPSTVSSTTNPNLYYASRATCTNGQMTSTGNPRQFAVQIGLESGAYCISN